MKRTKTDSEGRYAQRRQKILKRIKGEAALFPAAPKRTESRDLEYPYRQDSDFFYLTGFKEADSVLLLLGGTRGPRSIMFLQDRDPDAERWTGERLGLKRAKKRFRVDEVRPISDLQLSLRSLLSKSRVLHFAPGINPAVDSLVWNLFSSPVGPRFDFPQSISDSRLLTSEMRATKDRSEIQTIRHVCDITAEAFIGFALHLSEIKSEVHGAKFLESQFTRLGAHCVAFPTIVASGRNATVLHHQPGFQPLWRRELVLLDAGASFNGYAADISRTFPVSGKFSEHQALVYDVVYEALQQSIAKCVPGSCLDDVHRAAV